MGNDLSTDLLEMPRQDLKESALDDLGHEWLQIRTLGADREVRARMTYQRNKAATAYMIFLLHITNDHKHVEGLTGSIAQGITRLQSRCRLADPHLEAWCPLPSHVAVVRIPYLGAVKSHALCLTVGMRESFWHFTFLQGAHLISSGPLTIISLLINPVSWLVI